MYRNKDDLFRYSRGISSHQGGSQKSVPTIQFFWISPTSFTDYKVLLRVVPSGSPPLIQLQDQLCPRKAKWVSEREILKTTNLRF